MRAINRITSGACIALAVAFGLGGAIPAHAANILVAIAGPMTGPDAALGEQVKRGGMKAIEDINAKGGLLGQKLEAVIGDDVCDPKQAVSVANDLVSKKVAVVIGHVCSSSSIPASNVYAEANIVEISPASTNPKFTDRGLTNVFRVCGRDDSQGPTAAEYVAANLRGKAVAVLDDKQTYGQGLAVAFKTAIEAKGIKPVLYEEINAGEKDYSAVVTKLKSVNAQVVYYGGYYAEAGLIARQAKEQGLKAILIGGDGLNDPEFWNIAGAAGEGTLMTFGPDPKLDPANKELVKYFESQNYAPEAYTLYAYAAIQAWADAVKKAGTVDASKVEATLRGGTYQTALGTLGFNSKGDLTNPGFVVYVWKNGKPIYAQN
jgi:branched-chain amino acid transport system substrate-binding protein